MATATATLIKHSERTNRRPCRVCGKGGTDDKSVEFYWFHDTSKPGDPTARKYCREHDSNSWILTERDGTPHEERCTGKRTAAAAAPTGAASAWQPMSNPAANLMPTTAPVQAPVAAPEAPTAPVVVNGQAQAPTAAYSAFQAFIDALAPKVDAEQVNAIIDERLRSLDDLAVPFRVEVKRPDGTVKPVKSKAHPVLPRVIRLVGNARKNVFLAGPAGTGKSTLAMQVAEALDLKFYPFSVGPMTSKSDIVGYMNATGDYVQTIVYEAFKFGGLLLIDEIDAGNPGVFTGMNAMLANGHMAFPNGEIVERHADFRCIAAANTYGRGPDRLYLGRQAMDAATLDRFLFVTVEIDEILERSMCLATGLAQSKVDAVLTYARKLRSNAADNKMAVVISPRGSEGMCACLESGDTVQEAIDSALRKGVTDGDWRKMTVDAIVPTF